MKSPLSLSPAQRGSALVTVLFLVGVMAILTASMLKYSASEQRGNERNRLILRAKNMAESVSIYAAEQLTTKLYRLGSAPSGKVFPWTGTSRNRVYLPPNSMINNEYTSAANVEMRTGILSASGYTLINDTTSPNNGLQVSTARVPIIAKAVATTPALGSVTAYVEQDMEIALTPLFQFGMFYNMDLELYPSQAYTTTGPVHSNNRIMAHPDGASTLSITFTDRVTCAEGVYADSSLKATPRTSSGAANAPTLANGNVVFTHTDTTTQTSLKNGSNLWRDHKYLTTTETASTLSQFKTFATTTYNGNLRTSVHGVTKLALPGIGTYKELNDPSTPEDDRNNGRQIIEPPNANQFVGGAWVANVDDADTKESKLSWKCGLYIIVNPSGGRVTAVDGLPRSATLPDGSTTYLLPRSYRAWLNVTNTTTWAHTMYEVILPGQPAYGYNAGADTVVGTADDYMYVNNLPNRYTETAVTGVAGNQVLRTIRPNYANVTSNAVAYTAATAVTLPDASGYSSAIVAYPADAANTAATLNPGGAYFYDLRRANSNRGSISYSGTTALYDRFNVPYVPRQIVKIDFDMAKFKMMVARVVTGAITYSGYDIRPPNAAGVTFANSIFNAAGTAANFGLGMGAAFNVFPTAGAMTAQDPYNLYFAPDNPNVAATQTAIATDPRAYAVGSATLYDAANPCAWYDGISVYVHSLDAEIRAQTAGVPIRIDSGVRLWNGRGPAATLTAAGATGMTFVTNDAVYIIGHYNANGAITTAAGDISSRYPDNANEKLCAVMGDAINILSQPTWSTAAGGQDGGWNDALSALPVSASTAGWRTGASATASLAGADDGVDAGGTIRPGLLPNDSTSGAVGTLTDLKLAPDVDSEVSTALLVGIIPSNHNPSSSTASTADDLTDGFIVNYATPASGSPAVVGNGVNSGGANNFPRLLDNWSGRNVYIRGSMVALFESRVAMEPFTNSRCYRAPGRFWGLHENFRTVNHDVPLEPIVLGNTRVGFRALTSTEYATMKTALEALTALP